MKYKRNSIKKNEKENKIRCDKSGGAFTAMAIKHRLQHEQIAQLCFKMGADKNRPKNNIDISNKKADAKNVTSNRSCLFTLTHRGDRMRVQ